MNTTTIATTAGTVQAPLALPAQRAYAAPMKRRMNAAEGMAEARRTGKPVVVKHDGRLYLYCTPSSAVWRFNYVFDGKNRIEKLGDAGTMELDEAQRWRQRLQEVLAQGRDPRPVLMQERAELRTDGQTFRQAAEAWIAANRKRTKPWSARHAAKIESVLGRYVFPRIGDLPVALITPQTMLDAFLSIGSRTQRPNAQQYCRSVFAMAFINDATKPNPVEVLDRLKHLEWRNPHNDADQQSHPALTDVAAARRLLLAVEAGTTHPLLKLAHRMIALTGLRKMECMNAKRNEVRIDPQHGWVWDVPAGRMKQGLPFTVKLSTQAIDIVRARDAFLRGNESPWLFCNADGQPFSRNALNDLYDRTLEAAGFTRIWDEANNEWRHQHSIHGWRQTLSTTMNDYQEPLAVAPLAQDVVVELTLAHDVRGKVKRKYDKNLHVRQKGAVWQAWADTLITSDVPSPFAVVDAAPDNVVPIKRAA